MIRITDTLKPKDKFGSIPIRDGKPTGSFALRPQSPKRPQTFFPWAWLKKTVGLLLGLALILGLSSPLLVPYLATTLLAEHLAAALDRPVTIPRAQFNPLTSTLTLHNLIIGPKLSKPHDPVDPLLSASRLSLGFELNRLMDGEVACTVEADHFFLHLVRRKDGTYNLGQFIDALLPSAALLPLRFSGDTFAVSDSRLVFTDELNGTVHHAEEITLNISPRATAPAMPFRLQATINGVVITLDDSTGLTAKSVPAPTVAQPDPATQGETPEPDTAADPALKTAETITLVQDLANGVRQYLPNIAIPPVESRTEKPLTP
ncbi:MAG: hypothetical protein FP813_01105 [Desulfurivibrio sp.]|nr:hypothetical protein [Desulfurivibrio sp.]MBU4119093.1 hypothetical protein [Pseudomonadota bacterium]